MSATLTLSFDPYTRLDHPTYAAFKTILATLEAGLVPDPEMIDQGRLALAALRPVYFSVGTVPLQAWVNANRVPAQSVD